MNYFAHGRNFTDDPYLLAGTAVPDWLGVVDRRVKARSQSALGLVEDDDERVASVARGIVQHHHDDNWFHQTRAFAELSLSFTASIRRVLSDDDGLRPRFVGHILVELLLDAALIEEDGRRLDHYYQAIQAVDAQVVESTVNRIARRSTSHLATMIRLFAESRFLFDYQSDERLLYRLNQVMCRVGLPAIPEEFVRLLPETRRQVRQRREELLAGEGAPRQAGCDC